MITYQALIVTLSLLNTVLATYAHDWYSAAGWFLTMTLAYFFVKL